MTRWFHAPLQLRRRWKQPKSNLNKRQIDNGRYTLIHQIGQGASCMVHLAVEATTNKRFAIKEMSKSRLERQYRQSQLAISRRPLYPESKKRKLDQEHVGIEEIEILKQLPAHPNIIQFVQVIDNDPENEDSIFIVTELAEKGIVMDVTPHSVTKPIPEDQCRVIFSQLVNAVEHLHSNRIVHRDIKPQNLVMSNNNIVKLIDFGNATCITDKLSSTSSSVGSPAFMAPELLKRAARRQQESTTSPTCADLWSMGVTLYCLVYGRLPFERSSLMDLYGDIQNKAVEHSDDIDSSLKDLIDKLLEKNPENRIAIQDVKTHSWLYSKQQC
ncbi:kinase-like domain-containing protein [Parasitella parasitica]|nr:kinase-like domain-containing protein [Parasitella parasitica]